MLARSYRKLRANLRIGIGLAVVPTVGLAVALAKPHRAQAEGAEADKAEVSERCAIRLSISVLGKSPSADLLSSPDPQSAVDAMVGTPEFAERFARFFNAETNGGPSATPVDEPVYWLAKHIVTQKKPWTDMFVGPYAIVPNAAGTAMDVKDDANGLGYFRSPAWMKKYAGNEDQGYMLVAAFRIIQNTTGLELVPSIGNPGDDRTANGRQVAPCKSCHFDAWYALDTYAKLLPKRKGMGDTMTFTPPTEGPQQILGKSIADDKALVQALVDSDGWRFQQCRNVFKFLYGRAENQCEAPVFDKCVDALMTQKTIQSAVTAVAKDPSFCAGK
jgi:hypothetical protein